MASFLWKPFSDGGLNPGGTSVLLGGVQGGVSSAQVVGPNGEIYENLQQASGRENGVKFYSKRPGSAYGQNLTVRVTYADGRTESYQIPNGGQRYEGPLGDTNPGPSNKGSSGGGGSYDPTQVGDFGFAPADLTGQFPAPVSINYTPINPAPYKFTDPAQFAKDFGDVNRSEIGKNFNLANDMALKELDTELQGLQQFVPAAAALKRRETSVDNLFNQQQRTQQIDSTLPEVRGDLNSQAERARTYASGRAPDETIDRALELGVRSRAADAASYSGFGKESSIARKTSDLMSADRRIQLSQYGDQLLGQNVAQKVQTLLAPTSYSNAGQQVSATPTLSGSQLASQNLQEINRNTILDPATALGQTVGQNQFQSNLVQDTNKFNTSNQVGVDQFNASNANSFALNKFGYQTSLAGAYAGAALQNSNTQIALQQQAQAQQIYQDYFNQAQQSGQTSAIAQGLGAIPGIISAVTSIGDLINSFSGNSSTTGPAQGDVAPDGYVYQGQNVNATPGSGYAPAPDYGPDAQVVAPGASVPDGYTPIASDPSGGIVVQPSVGLMSTRQAFTDATGLNPTNKDLIGSSALVRSAGITSQQTPNSIHTGYDSAGKPVFSDARLARSTDTATGAQHTNSVKQALTPLGVLSKKDGSQFDYIASVAQDASFIAGLTDAASRKDYKAFVNQVLNKFGNKGIESLTDNPSSQAGLKSALSIFQLAQNWDAMSPAQKGLAVANAGIQGYKFATGEDLAAKQIISPDGNIPGLNVGQALNLLGQGYNVYALAKNWDQFNTLQKIAGATGTAAGLAQTAKSLGMLGAGQANAAVPGITQATLSQLGATAAPQLGIGAVTLPAGTAVPAGYTGVQSLASGETVAIPTANAPSFAAGNLLGTAAGVAGITLGAYGVYKGWGTGGEKGALNGLLGGSAIAGGLYGLSGSLGVASLANPYMLGGVVAVSLLGNLVKTGKSEDQMGRDGQRKLLQSVGVSDKNHQITLADGSSFDIGVDGHGQQGSFKGRDGVRRAWDTDYTNDMDYAASMGSISLTRLLNGKTGKSIDQLGSELGNAVLGKVGNGADFNQSNFSAVMGNLRGVYSQAGIKSKADAYALINQGYADGRWDESTAISMQQAANMMYDKNGFETAQRLMAGRNQGADVAAKTPENKPTINVPKDPLDSGFRAPGLKIPSNPQDSGFGKPIPGTVTANRPTGNPGISKSPVVNLPGNKGLPGSFGSDSRDLYRDKNRARYAV